MYLNFPSLLSWESRAKFKTQVPDSHKQVFVRGVPGRSLKLRLSLLKPVLAWTREERLAAHNLPESAIRCQTFAFRLKLFVFNIKTAKPCIFKIKLVNSFVFRIRSSFFRKMPEDRETGLHCALVGKDGGGSGRNRSGYGAKSFLFNTPPISRLFSGSLALSP